MKRLLLAAVLLLAASLLADEGKWTPQQVLQLDEQTLKKAGLKIPRERLWDEKRGTGLLAATINTGGCSGGFISPDGLFITNHHCLFNVLQENATPENDVITNGYLARSRDAELRSKTARVTIPHRFVDVTAQILAAIPKNADDLQRHKAIQKKRNELVAECEKQPARRCLVAAHDGGVQYVLQETIEAADVRLVWAPPRAIGEFGGEIDNWMWPRHTGDFAIGRVYVDGKPYKPEFWFPLAPKGVSTGDFVMVLGYPGVTYRALTAAEMAERVVWFEHRRDIYAEWLRIMESTTKGNKEGEIAVAADMKALANRQKNAEGQLAGMRRGAILEKQKSADAAVLKWAAANRKDAAAAYDELVQLAAKKRQSFDRDFLLDQIRPGPSAAGPKALNLALTVVRNAVEKEKPDAERDEQFMERNQSRLRNQVERAQKSYFAPTDKALMVSLVRLARGQQLDAIDKLPQDLDALYAETKVLDAGERMKMLGETPAQLHARKDPLLEAAFALNRDLDELTERRDRWEGAISRLRPAWRRAVIAHAGRPVAPDANSTLRVTFGHVRGYSPRDGLMATPFTTLGGMIAKHTNEEPFDVPDTILEAARKNPADLPVNFLSDSDTTGGNSGSPTVNGRGELVGVNFDRVWENVANDFGYNPDVARNVNADVRYLVWLLKVQSASELLDELGVK